MTWEGRTAVQTFDYISWDESVDTWDSIVYTWDTAYTGTTTGTAWAGRTPV